MIGRALLHLALTFTALGAAACDTSSQCECVPCPNGAINLVVFDADSTALNTGWSVEATHDGQPVDTSGCLEEIRGVSNSCFFGSDTGLYRITITSPDFQTRQIAARNAAVLQDCCTCVQTTTVNAFLER
jgi:hypothetical protein